MFYLKYENLEIDVFLEKSENFPNISFDATGWGDIWKFSSEYFERNTIWMPGDIWKFDQNSEKFYDFLCW